MSIRTHWANAGYVAVGAYTSETFTEAFGNDYGPDELELPSAAAVVIEDVGNLERMVVEGTKDELLALAQALITQIARLPE